jgi:nucleotidyltransferase/DNA polymerase involved in DNA repair
MQVRKIVHIGMVAFMRQWSSGMIRDCAANPSWSRDAAAGPSCAASYDARPFGVRSAK